MDTPKTVTHISLCAGYGGIDIGLGRAIPSLRTVAFSEIEGFACANLVAKMEAGLLDAAPIWTNLKTFPWSDFRDRVDILSGGYPCQPFSAAGKRLGTDDPRHLWPFIASGIRVLRPRMCFFENVEGHISLGLSNVIEDLAGLGYRTTWGIFSAAEVGAPHQRKRVFILAYRKSEGLERYNGLFAGCGESRRDASEQKGQASWGNSGGNTWPSRPGEPQHEWEPPRVVGDAARCDGVDVPGIRPALERQPRRRVDSDPGVEGGAMGSSADAGQPQRGQGTVGQSKSEQEPQRPDCNQDNAECKIKFTLGRNFDGTSRGMDYAELSVSCDNRTDELRLLGNGVVPATAELAFRTLIARFDKVI